MGIYNEVKITNNKGWSMKKLIILIFLLSACKDQNSTSSGLPGGGYLAPDDLVACANSFPRGSFSDGIDSMEFDMERGTCLGAISICELEFVYKIIPDESPWNDIELNILSSSGDVSCPQVGDKIACNIVLHGGNPPPIYLRIDCINSLSLELPATNYWPL